MGKEKAPSRAEVCAGACEMRPASREVPRITGAAPDSNVMEPHKIETHAFVYCAA
jgi:hypothetical protein